MAPPPQGTKTGFHIDSTARQPTGFQARQPASRHSNRALKKAWEYVIVSGANDLSSLSPAGEEMLRFAQHDKRALSAPCQSARLNCRLGQRKVSWCVLPAGVIYRPVGR